MTEQEALHIVRNPWGHSESVQREARHKLANLVEQYRNAYENVREFAEQNGLDTKAYGPFRLSPHEFDADVSELSECQRCGWSKDHPLHGGLPR